VTACISDSETEGVLTAFAFAQLDVALALLKRAELEIGSFTDALTKEVL
jgi:hypothetical protein